MKRPNHQAMRFKVDQKVVCTVNGKWIFTNTGGFWRNLFIKLRHGWGPKFNEVCTVQGYSKDGVNIYLKEYRLREHDSEYCFNESHFEPLMDISELTEILEQQPEHA